MKRILFFAVFLMVQLGFGQTNTWDGSSDSNWNTQANWSLNLVPTASHDVVIPNGITGTITVNTAAVCRTFTMNGGGTANTVTISGTNSLTVSGAITINAGTGSGANKILAVGAGSLSATSITMAQTNNTDRNSRLTLSTGTITVSGNISLNTNNTNNAVIFSSSGLLNIRGTMTGGALTPSTGTVNYNNGGAQTVGTYTYNNLTLSGSGAKTFAVTSVTNNLTLSGTATATTGANLAVGGALTVGTGTSLTTGNNFTLTVTGTTGVTGTLALGGTGNKRFDGLVTINTGGSWINNIANSPINFRGGLTNNGTFTSGTGTQTFDTNVQAISGTITMSNVAVTGITLTNNGNFYVQSNLSGTGAITNAFPLTNTFVIQGTSSIATITNNGTANLEGSGAKTSTTFTNSGTVNLSGSGAITSLNNATAGSVLNITAALPTITTLTATTSGNNVNYIGANQTVIGTTYSNLTLSGSNVTKTFGATTTVNNNLSIASGVVANLGDGLVHTARNLILGGTTATFGSWGSTVSAAANKTDTYFSSTGLLNVSAGTCVNNLISNGDFANGATGWTNATTQGTYVEINSENTYFSSSNGNNTAELDSQASLRQTVTVIPGVSYTVSFRYARRPNINTPATTGVTVSVIGGTPFTSPNLTTTSSTPQVGTFTFTPTSATIALEFYNTIHSNSTHGTIIDDIVLIPSSQVTPFATTIPPGLFNTLISCAGTPVQLDVNNVPASGVTYAWTGSSGAVFSSTNIKNPVVTFTGSGIQQATVTVTTSGGCLSSSTTYVNLNNTNGPTITTAATPAVVAAVCQSTSAQTTTMAYTATTNSPTTYSIDWNTLADQGSTAFTTGGSLSGIIVPAGTPAGTYTGTLIITNASCSATKAITMTVNPILPASVSIAITTGAQVSCSGTSVTFTATPTNGGTTPAYQWTRNGTNIGGATSVTYTGVSGTDFVSTDIIRCVMTSNATPCLAGSPATSSGLAMTVNPLPSAPTVGTITDVTCSSTTGSVVLSGLQNGWVITQSGTAPGSYTSSGTSYTVTGLAVGNYNFTVDNGTCTSASTPNVPIADASSTTWDGSGWVGGIAPDATKNIIIASSLGSPFAANLTGCALTINTGVTATVPSGVTLTIINAVTTNGELIFENNASLVQTTNATNTGAIEYRRISTPMKNFDYTYWSSPVKDQNIVALSPNTLADKYFRFNGAVDDWEFYNGTMVPGVGYIIRTPKEGNPWPNGEIVSFPYSQPVAFKGVPNNGNYSFVVGAGEFNLIGNPYPSAIDADSFINTNGIINGALYFWTHNTAITNNEYTADDYASYTLTGGTGTGVGNLVPEWVDTDLDRVVDLPGEYSEKNGVAGMQTVEWTDANTNLILETNEWNDSNKNNIAETGEWIDLNNDGIVNCPAECLDANSNGNFDKGEWLDDGDLLFETGEWNDANFDKRLNLEVPQLSNKPEGKIAAGQSFFVENAAAGSFQFTNAMRVAGNNSQFFKQANTKKTATVEKNRVWLNLTNSGGAFKQLLVGYITGATNDWDNLYDGPTFDGQEFVDFYSVNQGKNLTIQGRALPFVDTDVVPLGYRSTIAGPFDISIDNRDGALAGQAIWLEDKKTNTLHELSKGKYTFTAINGVENDRFVLKYTGKTLGTDDNEVVDKSLIVSVKNKKITLTSSAEAITQVQLFDLLGRKVYDKSKINAQEWSISNLPSSEQTLIVKTTLANGAISNKKIIY